MRTLLLHCPPGIGSGKALIGRLLQLADQTVVNLDGWSMREEELLRKSFADEKRLSICRFDSANSEAVSHAVLREDSGFDVIVSPPGPCALTSDIVVRAASAVDAQQRLRAIGCPNDSISHLAHVAEAAGRLGIPIIHTPAVHADAVAEYTLCQLGFHSRQLSTFYEETGRNGRWPHDQALNDSHLLRGRVLGVIGGSGKDGGAVVSLALRSGIEVIAIHSGSESGRQRLLALGATICDSLNTLLARSDFISINCRVSERTRGLIGQPQIEQLKPGVIIINPAGAEILDKGAIMEEFARPAGQRRIGKLILDMPFGGRRDDQAFLADPDNAVLRRMGVLFTPRMAGYTVESQLRAVSELVDSLRRYLLSGDITVPVANQAFGQGPASRRVPSLEAFTEDAVQLAIEAGATAVALREVGLAIEYKADGSPTTNADLAAEAIIREGLWSRGYRFEFHSEESNDIRPEASTPHVVVDGIDGTRNFRDRNYGWCVSVALRMGGETVAAVVHDHHTDETFFAMKGCGAQVRHRGSCRVCNVPKSLPPDFSFSVGSFRVRGSAIVKGRIIDDIKLIGGRGRKWGSVALSICAVARGGLGAFIQSASHPHDYLAALLIAAEAGAGVSSHQRNPAGIADIIVAHPSISVRINQIFDLHTRQAD